MNLAVIGQLTVGVACSGIGGVYFLAPQWLGVYSDIDIYGFVESSTTVSTDSADNVSSEPKAKKMQCWIESQPQNKLECKIFASTVSDDDTKNYIDVTKLTEQKTNITSSKTNTYYKITVSDKLLWKETSEKTPNILVSTEESASAKIKPLFAYNKSSLIFEDKLSNSNKTYHIGEVKKINITQAAGAAQKTVAETITKNANNKYKCSFSQDGFQDCDIVNLQTTDTTKDNLGTMTFVLTDTQSTSIKENNFYLIKSRELNRSFYVTTETTFSEAKAMKIEDLEMAVVTKVKEIDKLFHFPKNQQTPK